MPLKLALRKEISIKTTEHIKKFSALECVVPLEAMLFDQSSVSEAKNQPLLLQQELRKYIFNTQDNASVLLLSGPSGCGKTWFGQKLVLDLLEEFPLYRDNDEKSETTDDGPIIPLWVPLITLKDFKNDLLSDHLYNNLGITDEDALADVKIHVASNEKPKLFLVLDGYDELYTHHELLHADRFKFWPGIKVMFTCCLERLKDPSAPLATLFTFPEPRNNLLHYKALPFDQRRVVGYIRWKIDNKAWSDSEDKDSDKIDDINPQEIKTNSRTQSTWNAQHYLDILYQLTPLEDMATNPLMLYLIVDMLPAIWQQHQQSQSSDAKEIKCFLKTRYSIYNEFFTEYFKRQYEKLKTQSETKEKVIEIEKRKHKKIPDIWREFSQRLAKGLVDQHQHQVICQPQPQGLTDSKISDPPTIASQRFTELEDLNFTWLFDDEKDTDLPFIRSGMPLRQSMPSHYEFWHPSLLEFFYSQNVFENAVAQSWLMARRNLNTGCLMRQPSGQMILNHLADLAQNNKGFCDCLWEVIELSKDDPTVWRAAAHAATILNYAGIAFARNLSRARLGGEVTDKREIALLQLKPQEIKGEIKPDTIADEPQEIYGWGADLSGVNADGADFSDADLRFVNFSHAWLHNALFDGACLDYITLGELPSVTGTLFCQAPDGQHMAVARIMPTTSDQSSATEVLLFNVTSGTEENIFLKHPTKSVHQLLFSRDSKQLVMSRDEGIDIWDVSAKALSGSLPVATVSPITQMLFSPDGRQLFACSGKTLYRWDDISCKHLSQRTDFKNEIHHFIYIATKTGHLVVMNRDESKIWLWSLGHTEESFTLTGHCRGIACADVIAHADCQQLVTGSYDATIRIWNLTTKKHIILPAGHETAVTALRYLVKMNQLISGGQDMTVRIWHNTGLSYQCHRILTGHSSAITKILLPPLDAKLAQFSSVSRDNTIRSWHIEDGHCQHIITGVSQHSKMHAEYTQSGRELAYSLAGDEDAKLLPSQSIGFWRTESQSHFTLKVKTTEPILQLHYNAEHKYLIAIRGDGSMQFYNTVTGMVQRTLRPTQNGFKIFWHIDGYYACIHRWHGDTGIHLNHLTDDKQNRVIAKQQHIHTLAIFIAKQSEQRWLAYSYEQNGNNVICVYNLVTHENHELLISDQQGAKLIFSSQGQLAAISSLFATKDHRLYTWDMDTLDMNTLKPRILEGDDTDSKNSPIENLLYSADGSRVIALGCGQARMWNAKDGRFLWAYRGAIQTAAFSPNNQQIALGNGQHTTSTTSAIYLREVNSGLQQKIITAHIKPIINLLYSPNGLLLASTSFDNTLRLWDLKSGVCLSVCLNPGGFFEHSFCWLGNECLASGNQRGELHIWELEQKEQKKTVRLAQQSNLTSKIMAQNVSLAQVTGLSAWHYRLFQQASTIAMTPVDGLSASIRGKLDDHHTSRQILDWRKSQIRITEETYSPWVVGADEKRIKLDLDLCLLSLVREAAEQHTYLLIQGAILDHKDKHYYSDIKELHFRPIRGDTKTGYVTIIQRAPRDLQAKIKKKPILTRSCWIKKSDAEKLLLQVTEQRRQKIPYHVLGSDSFICNSGGADNCLTWCENQIRLLSNSIDDDRRHEIKKLIKNTSLDSIVAHPTIHLPESKKCLIM